MTLVRELAAGSAGAEVLDVNVGVPGVDDVALLPHVVKVVAQAVDVPICIDTPNPAALAAALAVVPGKPLVNSVNGEEASLSSVLPLVKDRGAAVIGLTMDDNGIPMDAESRLKVAGKILERAAKLGIPASDVIIDPLVLTVGADSHAGVVTLTTIELVRKEFGVSINLGASNVSFGLPDRHTINQAFLALAVGRGANCLITDPGKLAGIIRATDLLMGRDEYACATLPTSGRCQGDGVSDACAARLGAGAGRGHGVARAGGGPAIVRGAAGAGGDCRAGIGGRGLCLRRRCSTGSSRWKACVMRT
jgi:5-methyltetrahydrofolate--homocysteine methyltransferase